MRQGISTLRSWTLAMGMVTLGLGLAAPVTQARTDIELPTAYGRFPENLYAIREPNIFTHNVGLLTLQIPNVGIIGNPFIDDFSAGWRGGEYLYFSGLWIGARGGDSELHVSTASPLELRPELDARWTVYESYEGVKGGTRASAQGLEAADDDGDGLIDEDFQNGLDDDGDGLIDEDFAAIGQQMFSCMYKDDTPEAISQVSDHYPLNLLIQQRSFQWSTANINEFVGFDFKIINHGDQRLKDLYIGFFSDSDAGPKAAPRYWSDDLVGWAHIDTTVVDQAAGGGGCSNIPLQIDTAFMWDAPDNGTTITGGDVPGVFGSLFLGHTTDDTGERAPQSVGLTTVAWFSSSGANSDPQNDEERYLLLSRGTKPGRNANKPDDYRYVIAAGPFGQLNPGESLSFQTAYVIGDGQSGFRTNAINAQRVFNGVYFDADKNPNTGVDGKERCLQALNPGDVVNWTDPCDTNLVGAETKTIKYTNSAPCNTDIAASNQYVDDDCNPCTGVGGKETLVQWVGPTAPPPPGLNTDPGLDPLDPDLRAFQSPAGDKSVILQWDNASELRKDPLTGQNIFHGYRVWRVDNWQRPEGSIGPALEEWMKIAEFWKTGKGVFVTPEEKGQEGWKNLFEVRQTGVQSVGKTDDGDDIYPIGRYQYEDDSGIINGKVYFYAVTAFGFQAVKNEVTGEVDYQELSGLPSAVEAERVVPRWDTSGGCDAVGVVPNPYRGGADWDLIPSERDPTGTKIAFRNLPQDDSPITLKIYTLSGDLVKEVSGLDTSGGNGTYFWDLITRSGQNVVSGVYLYSITYSGGTCRGRFVIIR